MTFQPVKKTFPFGRLVQTAAGSSTSVTAALIIRGRSLCTHKERRQTMKLLDDMDVKVTTTTVDHLTIHLSTAFINSLIIEANADVSVYFGG